MDSIEKAKTIVAGFMNCAPNLINDSTILDRESLRSSIMVHRLYAALKSEGIVVDDYSAIKTFGDLKTALNPDEQVNTPIPRIPFIPGNNALSVGIDIEPINNLPDTTDYREDIFYSQNFSSREIAWCILKTNPKESFTGLFAAKEALVKADPALSSQQFSLIEIDHDTQGKPLFEGFAISISHADRFAIAVAARINQPVSAISPESVTSKKLYPITFPLKYKLFIYIALLLSLISVLTLLLKQSF
jgi:phosphopantetheine--protein transferase-like protein